MRKYDTYKALDGIEKATPIFAYPIMSEQGVDDVIMRVTTANDKLREIIGMKKTETVEQFDTALSNDFIKTVLEHEVGEPLISIEDILRSK